MRVAAIRKRAQTLALRHHLPLARIVMPCLQSKKPSYQPLCISSRRISRINFNIFIQQIYIHCSQIYNSREDTFHCHFKYLADPFSDYGSHHKGSLPWTCSLEICPHRDCAVYFEVLCRLSWFSSLVSHRAQPEGQQRPEHITLVGIQLASRLLGGFEQRGSGSCCSIPLIRCWSLVGLQGSAHAHSIEERKYGWDTPEPELKIWGLGSGTHMACHVGGIKVLNHWSCSFWYRLSGRPCLQTLHLVGEKQTPQNF